MRKLWALVLVLIVSCGPEKKDDRASHGALPTTTEAAAGGSGGEGAAAVPKADVAVDADLREQLLRTKSRLAIEQINRQFYMARGLPHFRASSGSFVLIPLRLMTDSSKLPESAVALQVSRFAPYYNRRLLMISPEIVGELKVPTPPDSVDHSARQSPIRNQASRGTCVAHASLAGLEARTDVPNNLSEEFAYHDFMGRESSDCCADPGLRTIDSAVYLSAQGVPEEAIWGYQPSAPDCRTNGTCALPKHDVPLGAATATKYRITSYSMIPDAGASGASIKNPAYLETLLANGFEIVWGTHVAWDDSKNGGVLDVVLDSQGNPVPSQGGHAMLIVGYNRPQNYFIVKNSWDTTWGHSGYGHFSYDYIRTYSKYGYIIRSVAAAP